MDVRRALALILVIFVVVVTGAVAVERQLKIVPASSFASSGDEISGWKWLRAAGHQASWTFDAGALQGARPSSTYLNVQALVTNTASGGAGYSGVMKLEVTGSGRTQIVTVNLDNPFRPRTVGNSSGAGYEAYGSAGPLQARLLAGGGIITVKARYPFPSGRHIAVRNSSIKIACEQ